MKISGFLIKQKIAEYLFLLKEYGYIKNEQHLSKLRTILNSITIERIYNAPGDAVISDNTLKICYENIEKNMLLKGNYYLDEVLFHEFSHAINSLHNSIYGPESFIIRDYIESKMDNFTTIELLERTDNLLYNQDPCFGIILLDEFIAQTITQDLIIRKNKKLSDSSRKKYVFDNLEEYIPRNIRTEICEPTLIIPTSLATYPEFYVFAQKFINKYGYNTENFVKDSLIIDLVKNMINKLDNRSIKDMYIDLCYLGIIQQRVYLLKGFTEIENKKDPAYNPTEVHAVMKKILKKI